jgi:hypothetical protein
LTHVLIAGCEHTRRLRVALEPAKKTADRTEEAHCRDKVRDMLSEGPPRSSEQYRCGSGGA